MRLDRLRRYGNTAALYLVLAGISVVSVLPFVWIILSSFKPHEELYSKELTFLPHHYTWANYSTMFERMVGFDYYYRNSILVSFGTVILTLFAGSLAAYALARFRFKGDQAVFVVFLATIMVPGEVGLIGQYELLSTYGLLNTLTGLTLSYTAFNLALTIFIMRSVFATVPQELLDAARVDGCSWWETFWQVMIPMGASGLAAAGTLVFLNAWNEFIFALTMNNWTDEARTLTVGIQLLQGQWQHWDYGVLFSSVMLSFLPVIILFLLLQKTFMRGLTAGAVKG
ncbi:MAG: carbohydrate ABC transporter permease [Armatimonadota bacterium]|nr:MAG: carbohydrate ABC transporter permease [Armatimonadota bacterium]